VLVFAVLRILFVHPLLYTYCSHVAVYILGIVALGIYTGGFCAHILAFPAPDWGRYVHRHFVFHESNCDCRRRISFISNYDCLCFIEMTICTFCTSAGPYGSSFYLCVINRYVQRNSSDDSSVPGDGFVSIIPVFLFSLLQAP